MVIYRELRDTIECRRHRFRQSNIGLNLSNTPSFKSLACYLVAFTLLLTCCGQTARGETKDSDAARRKIDVDLDEVGTILQAHVDGGEVTSGKIQKFLFRIKNPTDFELRISALETSCSCARAEIDSSVIPSSGWVNLSVAVTPPERRTATIFYSSIKIKVEGEKSSPYTDILIRVSMSMPELLCFPDSLVPVSIRSSTISTFQIPLVCGDKISTRNLFIEEGLPDAVLDAHLVSTEGTTFLEFNVDGKLVPRDGLPIPIVVRVKGMDISASVTVVMKRDDGIAIVPKTIQFSLKDGLWEANAMVRCVEESNAETKQVTSDTQSLDLFFDTQIKGRKILVSETKRLGKNFYRLKLVLSPETVSALEAQALENGDKNHSIEWTIRSPNKTYTQVTPVRFY